MINDKIINYENSINLDSTDAFEGPEKLLEIWIAPNDKSLPMGMPSNGLRSIPDEEWQNVLDHVNCKILSKVKTNYMDSFVLSESSLFVFPHKLILKTCGTTTTLAGIEPLQRVIAEYANYPRDKQPWRVFYSRKSFMFPEMQKDPHRSWDDEVAVLDGYYDNGTAYVVGNIKADHWYLYATVPMYFDHELKMPVNVPEMVNNHHHVGDDETLEILMTDLSPVHAGQFFTERVKDPVVDSGSDSDSMKSSASSLLAAEADDEDPGHEHGNIMTNMAKIDKIYPTKEQVIDAFCFSPCGYSCNGLVTEGHYFTIHVTPEEHCSYASFETNVPAKKFGMTNLDVVEKLVDIFRPGKFSVTLFDSCGALIDAKSMGLNNYKRVQQIRYDMNGYDLVFVSFELK